MSVTAAISQMNRITTQYPAKKRKRPQIKKDKESDNVPANSNPSKRHRNRLNYELDNLAQLIPLSKETMDKQDKLSILRLAVSYLRNKHHHKGEQSMNFLDKNFNTILPYQQHNLQLTRVSEPESELTLKALHGFLLVITQDFNVLYTSETIQDYLGYPQCDVMNQSILDLVHTDDRERFIRHMQINPNLRPKCGTSSDHQPSVPDYSNHGMNPEMFKECSQDGLFHRSFICRLRCLLDESTGFLALHFTGHLRLVHGQNKKNEQNDLLPPEVGLFLLASPLQSPSILEIRTKNFIFRTKHQLDYTPLGIDSKGKLVLGYTEQQLKQRSGYEFIHSADMMHCADAHTKLMRQGESGLTVFRLLHKDNTWVWVTASARIVFRNGRPECIIATQRPILDQEGEEHMKKRENAFRFDFTGHAVLYGEVNPIGTQGGPENNPLDQNDHQEPLVKRQKMSSCSDTIDRKSLYGAQAMQRLDIYAGSLPFHSYNTYTKPEVNHVDRENLNDFTYFARNGTHFHLQQSEISNGKCNTNKNNFTNQITSSDFGCGYDKPRFSVCQDLSLIEDTSVGVEATCEKEPPRLHHLPLRMSSPAFYNGQIKVNSLKRSLPNSDSSSDCQFKAANTQKIFHKQTLTEDEMHNLKQEKTNSNGWLSSCKNLNSNVPKTAASNLQFSLPAPLNYNHDAFIHSNQSPVSLQHPQHHTLAQLSGSNPPSIIESLTINSYVNINPKVAEIQNKYGVNTSVTVPETFDIPQQMVCQDNTIQFDLQKVATDYQTTDPVSKIHEYLQENPSHALAIATGQLPEAGLPKLATEKIAAVMSNYTFKNHPQMYQKSNNFRQQDQLSKLVVNEREHNVENPYLKQPFVSGDDSAYLTMSISSADNTFSSVLQNPNNAFDDLVVNPRQQDCL